MKCVQIPGESRRAYIHVCAFRRWRPGRFSGNSEIAESADITGIFAISGEILRGVFALSRSVFNDPSCSIWVEYIPNMSDWRGIERKGYIFATHPGGFTSTSAHVVEVARGFRETRKVPEARKFPVFSQFPKKSLGAFRRFLERFLTIAHPA